MLKQYRAAVIGVICMIAAIIVTGLISLKDEQPTDTQPVIMAEQDMTADKESMAGIWQRRSRKKQRLAKKWDWKKQ